MLIIVNYTQKSPRNKDLRVEKKHCMLSELEDPLGSWRKNVKTHMRLILTFVYISDRSSIVKIVMFLKNTF